MTIGELIEKLSEFDPNLHVFIPGYEGGYADPIIGDEDVFELGVNVEWYYGPHTKLSPENPPRIDKNIVKGITLYEHY